MVLPSASLASNIKTKMSSYLISILNNPFDGFGYKLTLRFSINFNSSTETIAELTCSKHDLV